MTLGNCLIAADIHDLTTLFYVILRWNSPEWSESSMKSDLPADMPFAIWSLVLAIHNLFLLFMIWKNEIFILNQ